MRSRAEEAREGLVTIFECEQEHLEYSKLQKLILNNDDEVTIVFAIIDTVSTVTFGKLCVNDDFQTTSVIIMLSSMIASYTMWINLFMRYQMN